MFNNFSKKSRNKMLLHVFLYYPLGLIIAISVGIALLKFVGIDAVAAPVILAVISLIFIGIGHLSQIYKNLLKEDESKKNM